MYKKTTLPNKIRLITTPLKDTQTVNLLVLIKVGSRNEDAKINGAAHFIEHLMFKGTKNRPTTLDLSKELDGVGAEFNAFTGKDYTGYYIKTDSKNLSLAIDILSDMLLNSRLDKQAVEKEKGVIMEEINMYEDNPLMHIDDLMETTMFDGHPLGRSTLGTKKSLRGISREELVDFKNKFYNGNGIVIALSGNFTSSHIKEIEDKFTFFASSEKIDLDIIEINQKKPRVSLKFKETEQTQIALGFPAYAYSDDRRHALQLLSIILGGNMSSRLFLEVRERNGLAYFIRSSFDAYEDTGVFMIQAGLDKTRIEPAINLIVSELKKIIEGVTSEELNRAKEYVYGKTALSLEDTSHISHWYAQQELMVGQISTPEEKNKKIAAVTMDDVLAVAKDIINLNKASLAIIGPFKSEDKFKKLLK